MFVDATRGAAMGLVCLSHFGLFYFWNAGGLQAAHLIMHVALPATTVFMLVSGIVCGMLLAPGASGSHRLKDKLADRALFLLGPGHLMVRAGHWKVIAMAPASSHWLFATDVIGVSLILGIWIIPRTRSLTRAALGFLLFGASWIIYLAWSPHALYALLFKDFMFGEVQSGASGVIFPILPWLGFYFVALAFGEQVAAWREQSRDLARLLVLIGVPLVVVAVLLHLCRGLVPFNLQLLLSAGQKYPPGPTYLLFGSGFGVLLLATNAWLAKQGYFQRTLEFFALVGRNALVVFLVQYFVYYCGFLLLRLPISRLWPLYFGLSLVVNFGTAWLWERYFGSKYLTVGWPWRRRPLPATVSSNETAVRTAFEIAEK